MNETRDVNWLDSSAILDSAIECLAKVKALGINAALDSHGRVHKPIAKQLARALEPHRPLFIEKPLLVEHPKATKQISDMTCIPVALAE